MTETDQPVLDQAAVSGRIREVMQRLDLTQTELADRLGITQPAVSKYLRDRLPPAEVLLGLAHLADVSVDWLLTGVPGTSGRVAEPKGKYGASHPVIRKWNALDRDAQRLMEQLTDMLLRRGR